MSYIHHIWVRGADLTVLFARKQGLKGLSGRIEILAKGITRAHSGCSLSNMLVQLLLKTHGLIWDYYQMNVVYKFKQTEQLLLICLA